MMTSTLIYIWTPLLCLLLCLIVFFYFLHLAERRASKAGQGNDDEVPEDVSDDFRTETIPTEWANDGHVRSKELTKDEEALIQLIKRRGVAREVRPTSREGVFPDCIICLDSLTILETQRSETDAQQSAEGTSFAGPETTPRTACSHHVNAPYGDYTSDNALVSCRDPREDGHEEESRTFETAPSAHSALSPQTAPTQEWHSGSSNGPLANDDLLDTPHTVTDPSQKKWTALPCHHTYHAECFERWMISEFQQHRDASCPVCRQPVMEMMWPVN
ncbi:hypothetical protein DIPPA_08587 [Diplonema papillatum]|nr:hypothetical protein DIPPA_08587 [Diplonema papillatum]